MDYINKLNNDIKFLQLNAQTRYLLISIIALIKQNDGKLQADDRRLKGLIFPYHPKISVKQMLSKLTDNGFISFSHESSTFTFNENPEMATKELACVTAKESLPKDIDSPKSSQGFLFSEDDENENDAPHQEETMIPIEKTMTPIENKNDDPHRKNHAPHQEEMMLENLNSSTSCNIYNNNLEFSSTTKTEPPIENKNDDPNQKSKIKKSKNKFSEELKEELENNADAVEIVEAFIEYRKTVNKNNNTPENFGIAALLNKSETYYEYLKQSRLLITKAIPENDFIYTKQDILDIIKFSEDDVFWREAFNSIPRLRVKPPTGKDYKINTIYAKMKNQENKKGATTNEKPKINKSDKPDPNRFGKSGTRVDGGGAYIL